MLRHHQSNLPVKEFELSLKQAFRDLVPGILLSKCQASYWVNATGEKLKMVLHELVTYSKS